MKSFQVCLLLCVSTCAVILAEETNISLTVDRVTYKEVRWGSITPTEVSIFHSTGVATIPLAKLSPELQQKLGYDAQKAAQWLSAQQTKRKTELEAKRAAVENWIFTVKEVVPNGVIAYGYSSDELVTGSPGLPANNGKTPFIYAPDFRDIYLVGFPPPWQTKGYRTVVWALRDGVASVNGQALDKWTYVAPGTVPRNELWTVPVQLLICQGGITHCEIVDVSLPEGKEGGKAAYLARRLQAYISMLSGCTPPIRDVDNMSPSNILGSIVINPAVHSRSGSFCYTVEFENQYPGVPGPALVIRAESQECAEKGINDFVRANFGVPLSAVDDPKFNWAARRRDRIVLNHSGFSPMRFPQNQQSGSTQSLGQASH